MRFYNIQIIKIIFRNRIQKSQTKSHFYTKTLIFDGIFQKITEFIYLFEHILIRKNLKLENTNILIYIKTYILY